MDYGKELCKLHKTLIYSIVSLMHGLKVVTEKAHKGLTYSVVINAWAESKLGDPALMQSTCEDNL